MNTNKPAANWIPPHLQLPSMTMLERLSRPETAPGRQQAQQVDDSRAGRARRLGIRVASDFGATPPAMPLPSWPRPEDFELSET